MKAVCIVQARMTSTRLPGKVMLPLAGRSVLWHVLTRAKRIPGIDDVWCAIPDSGESDPLVAECNRLGVWVWKGSETDVLERYYGAAQAAAATIVVRITSDCPMIDPEVCGRVLKLVRDGGADYASNVQPRGYPKGLDCEAFTFAALRAAAMHANDPYDIEHVTPWIQRNGMFVRVNLVGDLDPDIRWTLDTSGDHAFLSDVFGRKGEHWGKA